MRVLSYNILHGGTGRAPRIAAVIRDAAPDLVLLQEAIDPAVVADLARETGLGTWGAHPRYSTAYLSRAPVTSHRWLTPRGARHPFLEVVLEDGVSRAFGLHLSAWFSKWSERRRARELRLLLESIREHEHGFHFLAGDFNALAPGERLEAWRMPRWIQAMIWVSGRDIARDTIQLMLDSGYVDAWRVRHPAHPGHTFPTWDPHVRLDYVFLPSRYAARLSAVEILTGATDAKDASDHYPLLAVVDEG
jgi:endonuclease/exonuclease/phosphatase family metal-dependent hydrolase